MKPCPNREWIVHLSAAVWIAAGFLAYFLLLFPRESGPPEKENILQLLDMAAALEHRLDAGGLAGPAARSSAGESALTANRLVPLFRETAGRSSSLRIGFFPPELKRLSAVYPELAEEERAVWEAEAERLRDSLSIYRYTVLGGTADHSAGGAGPLQLVYPIYSGGAPAGFLWLQTAASRETAGFRHELTERIAAAAGLLLLILLAIRLTFRRIARHDLQHTRELVGTIPLPAIAVDQSGGMIAANEAYRDFARRHRPQGKPSPDDGSSAGGGLPLPLCRVFLRKALQGTEIRSEVCKLGDNDLLVSAAPLRRPDGSVSGAVMMYQDVTELSRLRSEINQMERLSMVGRMAASLTHEVRNPLSVVRGFIQLLLEKTDNGLYHGYFTLILEELDRANEIVNDFLSLAQTRNVEKTPCDLNVLLKGLAPLLQADAELRGVRFRMELEERLPALALNSKEIKQLVINLARNSFEAMPKGGSLTIRTEDRDGNVLLHLSDTGSGIPEGMLDKLFQPFYSTKKTGTGLGLSVCQSIAEHHQATISVESEAGRGTTFTVAFPLPSDS
jgi:signal transduction histidine kinase